jgi:hypothetical protein
VTSVLVVDDDPDVCDLVTYKLEQSGFDVRRASDGDAALREVAKKVPDLVLLDVMMPGVSGLEVLERWRSDETTAGPGVALLFVTAVLGYGAFLTLVSVLTEELTYHRYRSWRDFALLVYAAVAENAGFRQLHAWWRLRGLAGAVLRRGPAWAGEPGAEGQSEPAFWVPAGGRHVQVR